MIINNRNMEGWGKKGDEIEIQRGEKLREGGERKEEENCHRFIQKWGKSRAKMREKSLRYCRNTSSPKSTVFSPAPAPTLSVCLGHTLNPLPRGWDPDEGVRGGLPFDLTVSYNIVGHNF